MLAEIKIHVFHTGEVCVAPDLPFGGEHCSTIKASGAFAKKSERLWLPVSALYYRVVVIRAPLQGLCYTVRDAVDWSVQPTARRFKKGSNHSPLQDC